MTWTPITDVEVAAELAKLPGLGKRPLTPDERDAYFKEAGWDVAADADYEDEPTTLVVRPDPPATS